MYMEDAKQNRLLSKRTIERKTPGIGNVWHTERERESEKKSDKTEKQIFG